VVDDGDPVGELVGTSFRYCVQSRIVVPSAKAPGQCPDLVARARVEAGRPVVQNISSGVTTMLAAMSSLRRIPPE